MPALPPVPATVRFEIDFSVGADAAALCRFYWGYTGAAPAAADCAAFASLLQSGGATDLHPVMHPDTSVIEIRCLDLSSSTGAEGVNTTAIVGTEAGGPLPAGAAVLQNHLIGRRFRGGKPRNYWPFGTDTDLLTRQEWTTAALTAFESALTSWQGLLIAFASGGTTLEEPVNVSYYGPPNRIITGSTGRVRTVSTTRAAPVVDVITASSINPHVSSQRRRNLIRS